MLKAIQSTQPEIKVMTKLGSDVNTAKKECQFIATILKTNVLLQHNSDTFLINAEGACVQTNNKLEDLISLSERG